MHGRTPRFEPDDARHQLPFFNVPTNRISLVVRFESDAYTCGVVENTSPVKSRRWSMDWKSLFNVKLMRFVTSPRVLDAPFEHAQLAVRFGIANTAVTTSTRRLRERRVPPVTPRVHHIEVRRRSAAHVGPGAR